MKIAVSQRTVCLQGPRTPFLHHYSLCGYSVNPPNCCCAPRLLRGAMAVHYSSVLSCGSNLGHKSMLG